MANTKVTGGVIADGAITAAKIASGALDGILNTYLTTNTYATQSYVTTAVNNLIDAAPASLNTLNELAAALNDDANFATTVTNSLATKLNLSGGNITGNLSVDTNVLFVDTVNDRVGVGTTSFISGETLRVLGAISLPNNTPILLQDSVGNNRNAFQLSTSDILQIGSAGSGITAQTFHTSGSERMRIDSSGNVIVGSTTANNVNAATLRQDGTAHVNNVQLANAAGSVGGTTPSIYSPAGGQLAISLNSAERMRIDGSGNVGIGTSSVTTYSLAGRHFELNDAGGGYSFIHNNTTTVKAFFATNESLGLTALATYSNHPLTFLTNNSEKMRIASNGEVGIGMTPFTNSLNTGVIDLANGGGAFGWSKGLYLTGNNYFNTNWKYKQDGYGPILHINGNDGDFRFFTMPYGLAGAAGTPTERMRITSGGNVGIGTTNADKKFTISDANATARFYGSGFDFIMADPISSLTRNIILNNSGSGNLNVLFGTTNTPNGTANYGSSFSYEGDGIMALRLATSSTAQLAVARFFNPNGQVGEIKTQQSSTLYVTSSDYRLKEDFQPVANPLDRINSLNPINFAWKSGGSRVDGFLAHEVAEIVPEAVTGEKDAVDAEGNPEYQGIDQSKLVPLLTAAIKELKAEIETLKSQINA